MPWMMMEENGKYCVYKQGADKKPTGKSLKCHGTKGEATAHMRALYANVEAVSIQGHLNLEAASLNEQIKTISTAFHAVADKSPTYYYVKDVYPEYLMVMDGNEEMWKVPYSTDAEGDVTISSFDQWKKQKMVDAQSGGFQFVELSGLLGAFDGLAASQDVAFVSMSGEELFIEPADLQTYMANGQAVIDSTRTSTGDVVGLPIDLNGHDHKGGAGWIKGFELDPARSIIKFLVEWTEEGANLIRGNVRRFFSPSVDPEQKVILGGSLTNWPASRNSMGQLLLKPIELSQNMKGITMPSIEETMAAIMTRLDALEAAKKPPVEMAAAEQAQQASPPSQPAEAETLGVEIENLLKDDNAINQLGEMAQNRAKELVKAAERRAHVVEFVSKVVGGTNDHPIGLPVRAAELTRVLLSLPEAQSKWVEKLLAKIWDSAAMVQFAESGVASDRYSLRKAVPVEFEGLLRDWVKGGKTAQSFFEVNPEAGNAEDFNLTPFISAGGAK